MGERRWIPERLKRGLSGSAPSCPHAGLDERFLPIRARDLARAIGGDLERFGSGGEGFDEIAKALEHVLEQECGAFEHDIADRYAWFNPDRDTLPIGCSKSGTSDETFLRMHEEADYLLSKANFQKLTREQIDAGAAEANSFGLNVRICWERVEELSVWVRGRGWTSRRVQRPWSIRGEHRASGVYRRMVIVSRLAGERDLRIMMFRDIPLADIEALLPNAEVTMGWFDRVQAFGGAGGALGSLGMKVSQAVAAVAAWTYLLWIFLLGFSMLLLRALLGYRRARHKRDSQRTQHLYYQNMSNNAGALHLLASLVAQEELKEAMLAWVFCAAGQRGGASPVRSRDDLSDRVNAYVANRWGLRVDFDAADGIETLRRLGLMEDGSTLRVVGVETALEKLRVHRRGRLSEGYHFRACAHWWGRSAIDRDGASVDSENTGSRMTATGSGGDRESRGSAGAGPDGRARSESQESN